MSYQQSLTSSSGYSDEPLSPRTDRSFWVKTPDLDVSGCHSESTEFGSDSSSRMVHAITKNTFTFDRNSIISAVVCLNGIPSYTTTTNTSGTKTDVCRIPGQRTVATIKRRELFPDTVKLPAKNDGATMQLNKWLRPVVSQRGSEHCVAFETDTGRYVWRSTDEYRLAMFHEDDQKKAVAFALRSYRSQPPILNLNGGGAILEEILVSFIILEQRLRMKEKRRQNGMLYGPLAETGVFS